MTVFKERPDFRFRNLMYHPAQLRKPAEVVQPHFRQSRKLNITWIVKSLSALESLAISSAELISDPFRLV